MNFEGFVNNTYPIGVVRPYESVKSAQYVRPSAPDTASLNGVVDKYLDKTTILDTIRSNPEIMRLLKENGIPVNINLKGFQTNVYKHSLDTRKTAIAIYNNLPQNIKAKINVKDLVEGAALHDIGKVLIPDNILTKRNKLSPREANVMQLHSTLSYELLKNKGLSENVLNIIKYHHQDPSHSGYPAMPETQKMSLEGQIVSLADKYSALREKRSYKSALSVQETMNILSAEMNKGVSPEIYRALNNYAMSSQDSSKTTNSRATSPLTKLLSRQ